MKRILFILCFLYKVSVAQNVINKMEYWIDVDPGYGLANNITGFTNSQNVGFTFPIPANLSEGFHYVGIRSRNDSATWSQTNITPFYIVDSSSPVITKVEYFWNVDSGYNQGSDTVLTNPTANINYNNLVVPITRPLFSNDTLYVRSQDNLGRWSMTNRVDSSFFVKGVVSIEELMSSSHISISPNPFSDVIKVHNFSNILSNVSIYDLTGKIIHNQKINQTATINLQQLGAGTYYIMVEQNNKIFKSKIVKK